MAPSPALPPRTPFSSMVPGVCISMAPSDHPVEVVGRIRYHPDRPNTPSALQILPNCPSLRVKTDQGYREFSLDGVSLAQSEDLHTFYSKYVQSRIESVKLGARCTVIMYGPTGAGKSHTMFGSAREPGIAYRALQNILGASEADDPKPPTASPGYSVARIRVNVTILEIYNEEIFDMLASYPNSPSRHWTKPNLCRVRLEIMGKKVKNAVSISGTDAQKIAKEITKVEKRRVMKSTFCNDRSSRSHCIVMLEVPSVGGRLVLVDMAGSENLEQAGLGTESKFQTGKINQGNVALKRVVEAIANGDSHIPFRDSKLTMLLQDSFEDDGAKILMILCASPDPRDMHKTIGTLEYGSRAKCIVRLPASPVKDKSTSMEKRDPSILEARIRAMDTYISKLQAENENKVREKEETDKELMQKEQDLVDLRKVLDITQQEWKEKSARHSENYDETFRLEIERRLEECQRVADEFIEYGKKRLEEKLIEQQKEIDSMRTRMEEIEREVGHLLSKIGHERAISETNDVTKTEDDNNDKSREALESVRERVILMQQDMKLLNQQIEEREDSEDSCSRVSVDLIRDGKNNVLEHKCEQLYIDRGKEDFREMGLQIIQSHCAQQDQPNGCTSESKYALPMQSACATPSSCEHPDNMVTRKLGEKVSESTDPQGYSGNVQSGFDVLELGAYDRTGWLPIIPEESEEEDEKLAEDELEHKNVHVRAPCLDKTNNEQRKDLVSEFHKHLPGSVDYNMIKHLHKDIGGWLPEVAAPEVIVDDKTCKVSRLPGNFESLSKAEKKERADTCPGFEGETGNVNRTNDQEKQFPALATSRRSRIENIFMLCGNHRELAANNYKPINEPVQVRCVETSTDLNHVPEDPGLSLSELQNVHSTEESSTKLALGSPQVLKVPTVLGDLFPTKSTVDMEISPVHTSSAYLKHPLLENTPPHGMVSSVSSPTSTSFSVQKSKSPKRGISGYPPPLPTSVNFTGTKRNHQVMETMADRCEVYVKWETSRDSSGKLITIIKMHPNATLAEVRKEIELHISDSKHDFVFLMLGDPSGAPVERCTEADLQVALLPDCHKQRGSKLACLRPHLRRNSAVGSLGPLSPMENQISWKSPSPVTTPPVSFSPSKSNNRSVNSNSSGTGKTSQRLSFPLMKGLRL